MHQTNILNAFIPEKCVHDMNTPRTRSCRIHVRVFSWRVVFYFRVNNVTVSWNFSNAKLNNLMMSAYTSNLKITFINRLRLENEYTVFFYHALLLICDLLGQKASSPDPCGNGPCVSMFPAFSRTVNYKWTYLPSSWLRD